MVPNVPALLVLVAGLVAVMGGAAHAASTAPPAAELHPPRPTPEGVKFADDELVDNRGKMVKLDGACVDTACATHCRSRAHATGRCDPDGACVCRDLKQKSRCAVLGFGCGGLCPDGDDCAASAGRAAGNIVNNNNILVMH